MKFQALSAFLFILTRADAAAGATNPNSDSQSILKEESRFIVRYKNEAGRGKAKGFAQRVHLELGRQNAVAVTLPSEAVRGLMNDPDIDYVEVDRKRYPDNGLRGRGPTSFKDRSGGGARRLAQTTPYGIEMVQADKFSWGATDRTICIIDSGYDISHSDLPDGSMVTGYNGNLAWNVDGDGHGTHVAGTITALNNTEGVVGVADGTKLYIVRVFGDDGNWAYSSSLADAANQCVDAGANIISMSLGGGGPSQTEEAAFGDQNAPNVLSIAAAGNDGNSACSFPASYPNVMSVAAVDSNENVASWSQTNAQVEIAAPGVAVLSTVSGTGGSYSVEAPGLVTSDPPNVAVANPFPFEAPGEVIDRPLVDCGLARKASGGRGPNAVPADVGSCPDASGNFACLVLRGEINFIDKLNYCASQGGSGIIIYNNEDGPLGGVTLGNSEGSIPAIGISGVDGQTIAGALEANDVTASFKVNAGDTQGSAYASYSGTSMATPHVSGVAAKVWSYHGSCSAQEIRDALVCNTDRTGRTDDYGYGIVKANDAKTALDNNGSCQGCSGPPPAPLAPCSGFCRAVGETCMKKNCETWSGCEGAGQACCCCDGMTCGGGGRTGTCQT